MRFKTRFEQIFYFLIINLFLLGNNLFAATTSSDILPPANIISKHISVTAPSPSLPTESDPYANLYPCPTNPVCRDVNGNLPAGKLPADENCPSSCLVERKVTPADYRNFTPYRPVKTLTSAICPVGYNVSHVYKVGPELVYNALPPTEGPPIPWNRYSPSMEKGGYYCNITGPEIWTEFCRRDPWYAVCPGGDDSDCSFKDNNPASYLGTVEGDDNGNTVQIVYKDKFEVCLGSCWKRKNSSCASGGYSTQYKYRRVYCSPPAGFYETPNQVPTAVVCTYTKNQWQ